MNQIIIELIRSGQIPQEEVPNFLDRHGLTEEYKKLIDQEVRRGLVVGCKNST